MDFMENWIADDIIIDVYSGYDYPSSYWRKKDVFVSCWTV